MKTTLGQFKTDPKTSTDGVWVNYVSGEIELNPDDVTEELLLKVARVGNPSYQAALLKAGSSAGRTGGSKVEIADHVARLAIAQHVLLDWKNLFDGDEENGFVPVPYSLQKSRELCTAPEYRDFYEAVIGLSRDAELFQVQSTKDAVGNS